MIKLFILCFILLINLCFTFATFSQQTTYWQQQVNYNIDVNLNDVTHYLTGNIEIEYINNSPHPFDSLIFHLWPNAYSSDSTAFAQQMLLLGNTDFYYANPEDRGFIKDLNFTSNNANLQWKYFNNHSDLAVLSLNETLRSGDTITISTPFTVKLPKIFSRSGHAGQAYQITQWYPKPAVFDKNGWHPMPYLNLGEYYAEFGNFDVSITLPKNYRVAATGNLMNEEELEWLAALDSTTRKKYIGVDEKEDDGVLIQGFKLMDKSVFPPSDPEKKTLRYYQENVHDFAWFADKRYNVLKDNISTTDTGKTITTWSFFTDYQGDLWKSSLNNVNRATRFMSEKVSAYPYNHITVVEGTLLEGAGGMEYPMITVIGDVASSRILEKVIVHEVAHNWFQATLATNERQFPWMDEGLTSLYENLYFDTYYPNQTLLPAPLNEKPGKAFNLQDFTEKDAYEMILKLLSKTNTDQPIGLPAASFNEINLGVGVYQKTSLAFNHLRHYLGHEKFDRIMQDFYDQWKFKHPYPDDLKQVFDSHIEKGQQIDWLFSEVINTTKTIDYAIKNVSEQNGIATIRLTNKGEIASPIIVDAVLDGKIINSKWINGFENDTIFDMAVTQKPDYYRIDQNEITLDIFRHNNTYWNNRIFSGFNPIRFQFLASPDDPYKTEIYYTPIVAWNNYDRWMLGLALYNSVFEAKTFEYQLMPLYSFTRNDISGAGSAHLNFYPEDFFIRHIDLGFQAKSFHFDDFRYAQKYLKLQPSIRFEFRQNDLREEKTIALELRHINIKKDDYNFIGDEFQETTTSYYINEAKFSFEKDKAINPFNIELALQQHEEFLKAFAEANFNISMKRAKRGIDIRLFAGAFLQNNLQFPNKRLFNFNLSGITGIYDYTFDNYYLGRSEQSGILSQHIYEEEGGLKIRTEKFPFGHTDEWIATASVKVPIPIRFPVSIFGEAGTTAEILSKDVSSDAIVWDLGLAFVPFPDIFEIYFPILKSTDLNQAFHSEGKTYLSRITFILNINELNPLDKIRNIIF